MSLNAVYGILLSLFIEEGELTMMVADFRD